MTRKDPDEMTPEELQEYEETFPEEDLVEWMEYIDKHGTAKGYVRSPEPLDDSLTTIRDRGCMVNWYCRYEGGAAPGCEKDCMFTRDRAKKRPNCFGFMGGEGTLLPGDFLFEVFNLTCRECRHFLDCCDQTDRRFLCSDCAKEGPE